MSDRFREDGERVERLLDEVRGMAGPATWSRVEELVHRIVGFYGTGLERILGHLADSGGTDARLIARLCEDEVVSSLLLLHGLHPAPTVDRIQEALDEVRPYLGSHAGGVEFVKVTPEGVVHLRLVGSCHGCPSSRATAEGMLRRAVEDAAPEITGVEGEGVVAPSTRPAHERRRWVP
ncbi:MAG: NifU family protein, partial [Myxococcaceae bacterium]